MPVLSLLGLGGAALQIVFEAARPYLLVATVGSIGYSFVLLYRRRYRPRPLVARVWITAGLATILALVPILID